MPCRADFFLRVIIENNRCPATMAKIWTDGCFDLFHFGHSNVLRQARELGSYLVVGVHSLEEINHNKGLPVMNDDERYFIVESCRWVDEVYFDAPFITSCDLVLSMGVDLVVHGNDSIESADGVDCYGEAKARGIFRTVDRTLHVSTTGLVGRMLLRRRSNGNGKRNDTENEITYESAASTVAQSNSSFRTGVDDENNRQAYLRGLLDKFSIPEHKIHGKVVYVDGTFDLFHAGHASILKKCKENGWYTVVGLFNQSVSYKLKRMNPIMSSVERELCVSACRYVNKIIRNAPLVPDKEFIKQYGIDIIVCGANDTSLENYHLVRDLVELKIVGSDFPELTSTAIVQRIIGNYYGYQERNNKRR
ncbi:Choline phosphate cytidylyltransferase/Predicted CDP-ethanolamine synthase [Trachipleistophora hominis]|uniref:ethanolamine-phosphate cytidylyltransferase n=1 Tax=Trachipleistophora hominis TaxID=72359 RepID=L7JR87_TRAHO|nr:Choline phosphate cytidylyltransferase/Predicted CDP-ethanolamine synthase [Trachipleistophora hominis]